MRPVEFDRIIELRPRSAIGRGVANLPAGRAAPESSGRDDCNGPAAAVDFTHFWGMTGWARQAMTPRVRVPDRQLVDRQRTFVPRRRHSERSTTAPHAPAIYLSSVYQCLDPDQADRLLAAPDEGYVYSRYSHPNGDDLAEKCRGSCRWRRTERAIVTGSGMAALSGRRCGPAAAGDHVLGQPAPLWQEPATPRR